MPTRIKFCGMTRADDVAAAVELGVDAVGLIFVPGAGRQVSADQARLILQRIGPTATAVGVFADATAEMICDTARRAGIGTVQLHGREPFPILEQLGKLRVIKVIRPGEEMDPRWSCPVDQRPTNFVGVLYDSPGGGGTGAVNDWAWFENNRPADPTFAVAGGLTPENVVDVIRRVRPYGVDVSSGIESAKGIKSLEKMRAFVAAVRAADAAG